MYLKLITSVFLLSLFQTQGQAQTPAGVGLSPEIWFITDSSIVDGENFVEFEDQTSNNFDAVQSDSAARPSSSILNSHNTALFDGTEDYLPIITKSYSNTEALGQIQLFVVFRTDASGNNYNSNWSFIDFDRSEYFNFYVEGDGQLGFSYHSNGIVDNSSTTTGLNDGQARIGTAIFNSAEVEDTKIRVNGLEDFSQDRVSLGDSIGADVTRFGFVGDGSEASTFDENRNNIFYDGEIAEIIFYQNTTLTDAQINQIESYLALKYGVSLDTNVVASDGTIIWQHTLYDGFDNNIAGIGRDDAASLVQEESISSSEDGILSISPSSGFASDLSFLLWGNNDRSILSRDTLDVPEGFVKRLDRVWVAQTENYSDDVTVKVYLPDAGINSTGVASNYAILTSSDTVFGAGVNIENSSAYFSGDTIIFPSVTLNEGDYFTLAFDEVIPGGISGLTFWFDGNRQVFENALGNDAAEDEDEVLVWQGLTVNQFEANQNVVGPSYEISEVNFNNALQFDGLTTSLNIPNDVSINLQLWENKSYVLVFRTGADVVSSQTVYEEGGQINGLNTYIRDNNLYIGAWAESAANSWKNYQSIEVEPRTTYVVSFTLDGNVAATGTITRRINGVNLTDFTGAGELPSHSGSIGLGATVNDTEYDNGNVSGTGQYFSGEILDMYYYNDLTITAEQIEQLESALAIKWGASLADDYISDENTIVWDQSANVGNDNNVALIAVDSSANLYQLRSYSSSAAGYLDISFETDPPSESYVGWADNNLYGGLDTNEVPDGYDEKLTVEWKVQNPSAISALTFRFLLPDYGIIINDSSSAALLVDLDGDFTDASVITGGTISGDTLIFSGVSISDGFYFSLAVNRTIPGGVTEGLVHWFKLGDQQENATIDQVIDISGNGFNLSQPLIANRPQIDSINSQPVASFDGSDDYMAIEDNFYNSNGGIDDITIFTVFASDYSTVDTNDNWAFLDYDRSENFNFYVQGRGELGFSYTTSDDNSIDNRAATVANNGLAQLAVANYNNMNSPNTVIRLNGAVDFSGDPVAASTTLGTDELVRYGFVGDGSEAIEVDGTRNNTYYDGLIGEIIFYQNNNLSLADIEKIESYLAIKYGITLSHDYVLSNDAVAFDFSEETGFLDEITFIARDDNNSINQRTSKSQTSGAVIRVVKDEIWSSDLSYLGLSSNGLTVEWDTSGSAPSSSYTPLNRIWRVNASAGLSDLSIFIDTNNLPNTDPINGLALLVNSGTDFSSGTTIYSLFPSGSGEFRATEVSLADGDYLKVALTGNITSGSGDFSSSGSWVGGQVPPVNEFVIIDANHEIDMDGDFTFGSLILRDNAILNLGAQEITIIDSIFIPASATVNTETGTINFAKEGVQAIPDLEYYNLKLSGSGAKNVQTNTRVLNELQFDNTDVILNTNDQLTLVSSATRTASVAELSGDVTINGDILAERYVTASARAWWHMASPFTDANVDDLQDEVPVTGEFLGASDAGGSNNASMLYYQESVISTSSEDGWIAYPEQDTSDIIQSGRGYRVFLRQDLSNPLGNAILNLSGTIRQGDVALPVSYNSASESDESAAGWNFVGNPYPSAIDWENSGWTRTNIGNTFYVWDALNSIYTVWSDGVGTGGATGRIASGQSFWVKAFDDNPVLSVTESVKSSTSTDFFRSAPENVLKINASNGISGNDVALRFKEGATTKFDHEWDGYYFGGNSRVNICSYDEDWTFYSINSLPHDEDVEIPIWVIHPANDEVIILTFSDLNSFEEESEFKLIDLYLGEIIDITEGMTYEFAYDGNEMSKGSQRFLISKSAPIITNLDNDKTHKEISVFPNPVEQGSQITLLIPDDVQGSLRLSTLQGQTVETYTIAANEKFVILDSLEKGVFVLEYISDNSIHTQTILVQ